MIIKLLRKLLRYLVRQKERKERMAYVITRIKTNPNKFVSDNAIKCRKELDKNFNKNFQSIHKKLEKRMRYYDRI